MVYSMEKRDIEIKHSHVTYHYLRNFVLFIMDWSSNPYRRRFFRYIRKTDVEMELTVPNCPEMTCDVFETIVKSLEHAQICNKHFWKAQNNTYTMMYKI